MKKVILAVVLAALCVVLVSCSQGEQKDDGADVQANTTLAPSAGDEAADDTEDKEDLTDYQSILDEYTKKLQDATPALIAEYQEEAAQNTGGITGLAQISNEKISELAKISTEGVQKMAKVMLYKGSGDTAEYQEYAGKLQDVYTAEAQKITDAYMDSAI